MYSVRISEQTAVISLNSISWLVFVMDTRCVFVRYEPPKSSIRHVAYCYSVTRTNSEADANIAVFITKSFYSESFLRACN